MEEELRLLLYHTMGTPKTRLGGYGYVAERIFNIIEGTEDLSSRRVFVSPFAVDDHTVLLQV